MRLLATLVLACGCIAACHVSPQAVNGNPSSIGPQATEDQIFDANRKTPVRLLRELYEKNQVLILGFPSHEYGTQYQILDSLLNEIGPDPRLKFIVLERADEDAPMLEEESITELKVSELIGRFSSEKRAKLSLCSDGEWAYTWAEFLPRIRELNSQRPSAHKLRVTSIDGVALAKGVGVSNSFAILPILEGEYRETATSVNFLNVLWKKLGPSDKVIMLYHIGHVIKTFTVLENNDRIPSNWMATFLRDHPDAESHIGIVLLDENVVVSNNMGQNVLKFTQRQASRYPNQAFGVSLAPFRGIISDVDTTAFTFAIPANYGNAPSSPSTLPAMLDGVIWLPNTQQWQLKKARDYLPIPCAAKP